MNCQEIKKHLPAYLRGELKETLYGEIKSHIDQCPLCASELIQEESLDALLDEWTLELPEIDFSREIMAEIKDIKPVIPIEVGKKIKTTRSKGRALTLLQDLAVAAAAVIIVFGFSFAGPEEPIAPQYEEKIGVVSERIENLSTSYLEATADTTNQLISLFEIFKTN